MLKKKLSRKEREFLRHRKEIMQAALTLFSEKGFSYVSIQEIAQKAEFAVGTLYKFFPTKESLYAEIFKEKNSELHLILMAALRISDTEINKMKSFFEKKVLWFKENFDYVRLYVTETFGVGFTHREEIRHIIKNNHDELLAEIGRLFKAGMEKKIFKKMDPGILSLTFNGITNGILFEIAEFQNSQNIDPGIILNSFLNFIRFQE